MILTEETKNKTIGQLLTDNAIGFLEKAIEEFDNAPKYSLIHFAASIELFLKARLALEHWTLVAEKIDDSRSNFQNIISGKAHTVSAKNARHRIEKVLCDDTDTKIICNALKSFSDLAEYRNKIVHFALQKMIN